MGPQEGAQRFTLNRFFGEGAGSKILHEEVEGSNTCSVCFNFKTTNSKQARCWVSLKGDWRHKMFRAK